MEDNRMGDNRLVKVSLILKKRHRKGKGLAFWTQEYAPGEKPDWINLPVSQVEMKADVAAGETVEVTLPEWLAEREGLI